MHVNTERGVNKWVFTPWGYKLSQHMTWHIAKKLALLCSHSIYFLSFYKQLNSIIIFFLFSSIQFFRFSRLHPINSCKDIVFKCSAIQLYVRALKYHKLIKLYVCKKHENYTVKVISDWHGFEQQRCLLRCSHLM